VVSYEPLSIAVGHFGDVHCDHDECPNVGGDPVVVCIDETDGELGRFVYLCRRHFDDLVFALAYAHASRAGSVGADAERPGPPGQSNGPHAG